MGKRSRWKIFKIFTKQVIKRFNDDGAIDIAATLAYFFLLSLFPLLIFFFTIIPYLGLSEEQVLPFLAHYVPDDAMKIIKTSITHVFDKNSGLLSFSIIATLWSASNAVNAIIRAMNKAYEVEENRSFVIIRGLAIMLTLAMIIVIVTALAVNVFGPTVIKYIFHYFGLSDAFLRIWSLVSYLISFLIIIVVFACLYYFGPNKRQKVNDVILGAVIAAVGWQVVSYGFSYYVDRFGQYSATYGTLGGIIVLMLWFYITALIIVLGGEINASYEYIRKNSV
ncbi:membrane protein [Scopulibacillus daqui]|uniref:Membrane protein n=1 Tax=Scopulibacillus daqui TaxID=1469162 RepID=A0ABS2PYR0_9BACL|nr:YihY/virulence factor BrkB family protein [Scopulibacillus daqui]MBM7645189.1 membrane protein [Scopulibacillus daqui]